MIASDELEISNFFSFLAAMMLAYQPVRSLATLNIAIQQGLSGAKRVLPVIDEEPEVKEKKNAFNLNVNSGQIIFNNVKSNYDMTQYAPTTVLNTNVKSSVFSVAFGLGGGVKYSFPRFGTIYCDLDLFYSLIQVESTQGVIANLYNNNQWRQLVFGFSIGYRKDLIW